MKQAFQKWTHFSNSKYQPVFYIVLSVSHFFNFVFKFEFPAFFQNFHLKVKIFIYEDKVTGKHFLSQILVVN